MFLATHFLSKQHIYCLPEINFLCKISSQINGRVFMALTPPYLNQSNFPMSSISSRALPTSSIQALDSAQTALENCIARIKLIIQQTEFGIVNEHLSKLDCPITSDFPASPVVTNCGHIFNQAEIQQWKDWGKPCAVCRTPLTQFTPIHALKEFVEKRLPKDPVLTCSNFKGLNQQLANKYLELAKIFINEKDFGEALEAYRKALTYTNSSKVYLDVPALYEQLAESEKATLSRLHLSLYQLQEGKIQEAIKTLTAALRQHDPEDRVFIYNQIIAHAPDQIEVYEQLIPLIKDPAEKKALLLKAAEWTQKVQIASSTVISTRGWASPQDMHLLPYPQELKDFLAGDCTIWPGKKRSETHIVVPLFPQVIINGACRPLTLWSLDKLDKSSGGPGYNVSCFGNIDKNMPAEKEFRYAVMTNDAIPGSRGKPYKDQLKLLPPGYELPGIFDAGRAILWENRRTGKQYFKKIFVCCKEFIQQEGAPEELLHFVVGDFDSSGLRVQIFCLLNSRSIIGIAGWRKF